MLGHVGGSTGSPMIESNYNLGVEPSSTPTVRQSYIYFIKHGPGDCELLGLHDGYWDGETYVKIGRATNLRTRLGGIQCGNPITLDFLGCMYGGDPEEKELHRFLRQYRARGEWFRYSAPVAQFISNLNLFNIWGMREDKCEEETICEDYDRENDSSFEVAGTDSFTMGCEHTSEVDGMLNELEQPKTINKYSGKENIDRYRRYPPTSVGMIREQKKDRDSMEEFFGGALRLTEARKFHLDDFLQPIQKGDSYYRLNTVGCDYDTFKLSLQSVHQLLFALSYMSKSIWDRYARVKER
jgi:hypothetical protein